MVTVLPGAKLPPSVVATLRRSFDSSEWNVPDVPSAQELLIVLGWFGSGPSAARPSTSDAPVSQETPTLPHFGALSVGSYTAVSAPAPVTVRLMLAVRVVVPEVPVTVTVEVPVAAVVEAVNVRVDVPLPLAGGVTELGANEAVTPLGR